ncbi:MAG: hypothetical protein ACTHKJ_03945 [Candidatus Nitrosocosmicus sp.]
MLKLDGKKGTPSESVNFGPEKRFTKMERYGKLWKRGELLKQYFLV